SSADRPLIILIGNNASAMLGDRISSVPRRSPGCSDRGIHVIGNGMAFGAGIAESAGKSGNSQSGQYPTCTHSGTDTHTLQDIRGVNAMDRCMRRFGYSRPVIADDRPGHLRSLALGRIARMADLL